MSIINNFKLKATTITEVVVVLLVLTILSGIVAAGVTTIRGNTQITSAKANLDRVIIMEKNLALTNGSFSDDVTAIGVLRGLTIVNTASQNDTTVSIKIDNSSNLFLAILSADGTCVAKKIISPEVSGVQSNVTIPATSPCSADAGFSS